MHTEHKLPELSGKVLWLIPFEKHKLLYRKEINRLSKRFDTVQFPPHITLGRLPDDISDNNLDRLRNHLKSNPGQQLHADFASVDCSDSPYQNLVASLRPSAELAQLQSEIKSIVPDYTAKDEYHVSLMYGSVSCNKLQDEIQRLSAKFPDQIIFSKMSAIQLDGAPESWKTIWEENL